jgi:hypothetical protein
MVFAPFVGRIWLDIGQAEAMCLGVIAYACRASRDLNKAQSL